MSHPLFSIAAWITRLLPMSFRRAIYRFDPLANLIRRLLNRFAPQGLMTITIAAGGLQGARLSLDLHSEKDYWLGTYEPELQQAIKDFVKSGDVVYDVGANIGYISLLCARQVGEHGKVFAFEALPANLERLRHNLELNGLSKRVQVVPVAVVDSPRSVRFWIGPSDGMGKVDGSVGRKEIAYKESICVEGLSLDHFVYETGHPPPDVLKIDIEGGEVLALPGMQRILMEARPLIFLESHGPEASHFVWERLVEAGYQLYFMRTGYPEIPSPDVLGWKAYLLAKPKG